MLYRWILAVAGMMGCVGLGAPNVLFVAVDDLNDWVGCMGGHPQAVTPHMDALASRGVQFTNAHCSAPACRPSRSSLFSGQQPYENGVYGNWGKQAKLDYEGLLPKHFAKHGYRTLGTGKMLHAASPGIFQEDFFTEQRWSPFEKDEVDYTEAELPTKGTDRPRHVVPRLINGRQVVLPLNGLPSERQPTKRHGESFDWGAFDLPDAAFGDGQVTDWAMARLNEVGEQPFFLGVGYYRPHIPLWAPKRDFDVYPPVAEIVLPVCPKDDLADLGEAGRKWALEPLTAGSHEMVAKSGQWREAVRAYLASVTFVDRQLGRLLAALDASEHADDTWIVLWSDHGWQLGEKRHWGKWTGWRQSTRVPLIIVPPRRAAGFVRGAVCTEPVSLLDLYPTLTAGCDLPPREGVTGTSLLPLLRTPQIDTGRVVVTTFDRGNYALSGKRWRYIRYASGEEELYDVTRDPHEWTNLAASPEWGAVLAQFRKRVADLPQ